MRPSNPYYRKWLTPRPDLVTQRERAVGTLLADGHDTTDIAVRLDLNVQQVEYARYQLYRKLHLGGRMGKPGSGLRNLVHYAIRAGWIKVHGRPGPPRKRR
jgi:DNA-binding NarL/FixJ family response regulator